MVVSMSAAAGPANAKAAPIAKTKTRAALARKPKRAPCALSRRIIAILARATLG